MPRVFFYVQHLLGIGHVFRALRVASGLRDAGFAVDLVLGGVPVPGLDTAGLNVIQLQPLKAGPEGFSALVTETGAPADAVMKARRTADLIAAFDRSQPDVVMIEAFPIGRRQVRFELIPLLEAAHARANRQRIVSSIRDILHESTKPGRAQETVDVLTTWFDRVIVHGDRALVSLEETFPLAGQIAPLIAYSGMVVPPTPAADVPPTQVADVVVSAGGGAVGARLIASAIAAKRSTTLADARWLVLTGPNAGTADFARLAAQGADAGVTVERFVPNLSAVLQRARLSVSQAGYNTIADILVAGCRAVFVPFAAGGETEQTLRAQLLQKQGLGVCVSEDELTPDALAAAVAQTLALPPPTLRLDVDGAANTARILTALLAAA